MNHRTPIRNTPDTGGINPPSSAAAVHHTSPVNTARTNGITHFCCCYAGSVLKHACCLTKLPVGPLLPLQHFLIVLRLLQVSSSKCSQVLPEAQV
jgi:hypothetical protein